MNLRMFVGVALFAACVSSLSPTVFSVATDKGTLPTIQRAMVVQGVDIAIADESTGVVQSTWESTGSNSDGTLWVHRYTVTIEPGSPSARVRVGMDLRTCENGLGQNPHDGSLDGSPCARVPGAIPRSYQTLLDEFAAGVRGTLGG